MKTLQKIKKKLEIKTQEILSESTQKRWVYKLSIEQVSLIFEANDLSCFGYNKKNLEAIKEIGVPMVLAILPNTPYAGQVARFAKDNDLEIILHLPLEPENETKYLEKDTINAQMDEQKIEGIINMAFDAVPFAVGVSNHMGSKATADRSLMALVFNDIKDRKVFFLDSFTSDNSVCKDVAEETKVPYVRRDIFIDNKLDVDYIGKQLKKAEERALKDKEVVVIGHDKSVTVSVLAVKIPLMKENGIKFVKLSDLVSELE